MITIAITGKIATGKTIILEQFNQLGFDVYNSDYMVRKIYQEDQNVIKLIKEIRPKVVKKDKIDLKILSKEAFINDKLLLKLEEIIHPKLTAAREKIKKNSYLNNKKHIVFEVPLLFEKKLLNEFNVIITTTCNSKIQKQRALLRKNMDREKFFLINRKFISDSIRFKKSSFIINTGIGKNYTLTKIKKIIKRL